LENNLENNPENRVAIVAIIVENVEKAADINAILHEYARYIIGRMGLPYRSRGMNIISVVVDAPHDIISALSGRIGRIDAVSTKTVYSKT
jgi:putative iron-only hydrogenase system regulator